MTAAPQLDPSALGTTFPHLQRMIRHYSVERFQSIAGTQWANAIDHPERDAFIYGAVQSIVLLAGRELRLTLKAHFNLKDVMGVLAKRLETEGGGRDRERLYAQDFFREFVNLTAGGIKGELQRHGIECGISLPVVTSGLDELFFSDKKRDSRLFDYWRVVAPGATFACTSAVDLITPECMSTFTFDDVGAAAQDVEFF